MALIFNESKQYSLGIELEIQLIDRDSYALVPILDALLNNSGDLAGAIKHELMTSNVEVNTGICKDVKEAGRDLGGKMLYIYNEASKLNAAISLTGSHPFSSWRDQIISDDKRYARLLDKLQIVARRFNIFGMHVHVGIDDREKCIYIINRFAYYLPHFLALSANSPFWNGENTGLNSYRSKVFDALPTSGLPVYCKDWDDYAALVKSYVATGTIETIREIWWDVRPHPDFGTIEIRICDSPTTLKEVLSISALIQALVARFGDEFDRGERKESTPHWIIRENKWRASRYGLGGDFISEDGSGTTPIEGALRDLISDLEEYAARLGSIDEINGVKDILESGNGASRQLEIWEREGSLISIVKTISKNLADELRGHN